MDYITEEDYKREIKHLKNRLEITESNEKRLFYTLAAVTFLNLITVTLQIVNIWLRIKK
ncbi:hypothetical protein [Anaerofustis stercorihominis]|uniref:hypothetical protein n=1 Tax=Anaerofustis stercorihominis TaxID=214853 RepID=UPI0026731D20|nr:hypothetical protein [Anaerofustis stercorihominis]